MGQRIYNGSYYETWARFDKCYFHNGFKNLLGKSARSCYYRILKMISSEFVTIRVTIRLYLDVLLELLRVFVPVAIHTQDLPSLRHCFCHPHPSPLNRARCCRPSIGK